MVSLVSGLVPCIWVVLAYFLHLEVVLAFSSGRSDNLAVYWGQDSAGNQQRLSFYCEDDTIDVIPLAFLYIFFGEGGRPIIDFANTCNQWDDRTFQGTDLADCSFLEPDIHKCQAKGKIVTLSLGGGTGKVGFTSDAQAVTFAESIWNMFLGGKSDTRPFGSAILDGIDLDIESGTSSHYATFVNKIRSLEKGANKKYYITAAPQCPFPDASLGGVLNTAFFDAVYVQFCESHPAVVPCKFSEVIETVFLSPDNNFCETSAPSEFNLDTWDRWARNTSPNKDIKVYLGAPAAAKAAGEGYVDINTFIGVVRSAQKQYPSFGGVMLWDADEAYTNDRYDVAIKNALRSGGQTPSPTQKSTPTENTPTQKSNPSTQRASPTGTPPTVTSTVTSPEPESFRDPRATARVKRPSFPQRNEAIPSAFDQYTKNSRFFRFNA